MRHLSTALLATIFALSCEASFAQQANALASSESTGTSIATAILIDESDDAEAIKAENAWLAQHFPGYAKDGQSLIDEHERHYDEIDITTASNEHKKVYFDITKSFDALTNLFK